MNKDIIRFLNDDLLVISRNLFNNLPKKISRKSRTHTLKEIGEKFVGHCIELWLWKNGYALNGLMGDSFTIEPQYVQGNSRIDFFVEINAKSNITCVIDSKNWARYHQQDTIRFMNQHIPSFNSYNTTYKLIFINYRLIPHIKGILSKYNVIAIPIMYHITDKTYIDFLGKMDNCMKDSIKHLSNIFKLQDVSKNIKTMSDADKIKYDIELGKPYKFLMKKWVVKRSYLDKLRDQMVKDGMNLPKRTTKQFTRLRQYNTYWKRK
jgi:hypothetical protein